MNAWAWALRAAATTSSSLAWGGRSGCWRRSRRWKRSVLSDHADRCAQALLRDVRDILLVDEDAALLRVEEAEQQVDDGGLSGAGAPYQPDSLSGLYFQIKCIQHRKAIARPVAERHILEAYFAARHFERLGAFRPIPRVRHRDRLHAFLHHADVLEDRGHLPAHPARHVGELPGRGSDAATIPAPPRPAPRARCRSPRLRQAAPRSSR